MSDLYSDNDPEYRATRVKSGIPPPSIRDRPRNHRQGGDLSRFNPAMQRNQQQQQRYSPYGQQGRDDRRHHQEYDNQRYSHHQQQQRYPDQRYSEQQQQRQPYPDHHQQQQQQRPPAPAAPAAPKPKPLELRTSTDFLKCEKRLSLQDLVDTIQPTACTPETDYDFLSSKALVEKVNQLRENIRHVPYEQRSEARSKSNPFERIGNAIFMNRAATKLAALDATFGLATTHSQEFTFADICGGPGGFSEYLLWRVHSWGESAHGFGITLKGSEEVNWHTEKFRPDIPRHSLTEINGADGTGDLYKIDNIKQFEAAVLKETRDQGVDLAVADGGFDFTGHEAYQELSAQRLLLCEVVTMLTCLKQGGHFVCKFFDILNESTAGLVWLLYQLFDEICITKPLSSRPANAERYIVCKGLVHEKPTQLVQQLMKAIDTNTAAISIVTRPFLEKDEDFIDYVKMRNIRFAMKQTEALEQMDQFIKNPQLAPLYDQEQVKRHCLNEWRLPLQDSQQHYF
ncbi:asparagine-linked glycosylation protein [Mucor velutinosus]|uniref:Cap-specific mRNA (nucleoside-2'-O-)-methyltransferase 1 n=1 Tax=Mucor velutinosus TaxID=708070 RepID=A0AAN7DTU1_9FUNG|nr:asparagine-linked glycosylation protein [Mucor velutinosus]